MSNGIFAPQGFVPINYRDGTAYTGATQPFEIDTASPAIGLNDPVYLAANGKIRGWSAGTTVPGTQDSSVKFLGIFQGCYYQTSGIGQGAIYPFVPAKSWPGSGVNLAVGTTPLADVIVDPNVVFNVNTGTPLTAGVTQAQNYFVAGFTVGTVNAFGISTSFLSSAPTSGQGAEVFAPFQIVGLADLPNNAWGQPYNNVLVIMNTTLTKQGTLGAS